MTHFASTIHFYSASLFKFMRIWRLKTPIFADACPFCFETHKIPFPQSGHHLPPRVDRYFPIFSPSPALPVTLAPVCKGVNSSNLSRERGREKHASILTVEQRRQLLKLDSSFQSERNKRRFFVRIEKKLRQDAEAKINVRFQDSGLDGRVCGTDWSQFEVAIQEKG
ncbi:hypothetical protein L596_027219 [Steinernema carpocapsae]|uniref:Uncharacterized protein n=1 Tax=Steinernema carpocapsae TaxID=34508 RepID=A0A4U5M3Q2_STECR|nr:hypothetical protein L596_027219 [Steinernema carpocapsae]